MRSCSKLLALTSPMTLMILAFGAVVIGEEPPLDIQDAQQVRNVFHTHDCDARTVQNRRFLLRMGEKAFPVYEVILSNPRADPIEVTGVFSVLCEVKVDRHRFLKHAVSRLIDDNAPVRLCAIELLKRIGSTQEASLVVALLSDQRMEIAYAAAKTLAVIGGTNEVIAMDIWLRGVSHREDSDLRKHVQKCRDALNKRLEKTHAKDPHK